MHNKIDERLPLGHGKGVYPDHAGIKTPWDKVIAMKEAIHYLSRYNSVVSAAVMQAWRIMVPDYVLRSKVICEEAYARLYEAGKAQAVNNQGLDSLNIHPFCSGAYVAGLSGDSGDEQLLMCGRVNDFGTYRVEKELDVCDWDICGTELCRATTMSLQAGADSRNKELLRTGPCMEYCMVEAKGAGDRHCRIVAESREKYPMPEHEIWESFGPIATADQIRFTQEEERVSESQVFRADANYRYESGTHQVEHPQSVAMNQYCCAATFYLLPAIEESIKRGLVTDEMALHTLKCVCEAAGKAAWGEQMAKEAHRQWLWDWYDAHKGSLDVHYAQITKNYHMFAVQGPRSLELVNALVKEPVDDLKFFSFRENEIDGFPVIINRAGYTGEKLGFEVYAAADKADRLEELLRAGADKLGGKQVTEFQVLTWTLPCEAGFFYMRDLSFKNPFEVGLERGIGWDKEFIGKEALLKIRETGPANEMLGFTVADADIQIYSEHLGGPGSPVLKDGEVVGRVQKCVYSYVNEVNNGYIFVEKGALQPGDKVTIHGHEAVVCAPRFL